MLVAFAPIGEGVSPLNGLSIAAAQPAPSQAPEPQGAPADDPAAAATAQEPVAIDMTPRKPSGFWTSGQPARGGAYRYRLLLIALVVFAITAVIMVRVIRRGAKERTA